MQKYIPKIKASTPLSATEKTQAVSPAAKKNAAAPKKGKSWFDKTVAWIHLWPSLVSALILIFVCLSGTIIVYCDEIMDFNAGEARYVQEVKPERLTTEQLMAVLAKEYPKRRAPGYMVYYKDPQRAVRFNMSEKGKGLRMVYVDPYTGQVLDDNGTINFFYIMAHLHNSFLWGKKGQWIVDIATIIFFIELITGLILWWPKKWTKATKDASFKIKWKGKFKRVNYDLHNVLGFYALGICFVLTITGLIIAFQPIQHATTKVFGGEIDHKWQENLSSPDSTPASRSIDLRVQELFKQFPEKQEAQISTYNLAKSGHIMVALAKSIGLKSAESSTDFAIDKYSGEIIPMTEAQRMHLIVENTFWNLHMGKWMGPIGKLLTFIGGIIATSLPITGFLIWWGRRKKKSTKKPQAA